MRKHSKQSLDALMVRQNKALAKAIAHFGSMRALGAVFGYSYQAVQTWQEIGMPLQYCARIETLMGGRVKCEQLREDWTEKMSRPFQFTVAA